MLMPIFACTLVQCLVYQNKETQAPYIHSSTMGTDCVKCPNWTYTISLGSANTHNSSGMTLLLESQSVAIHI